MRLAPPDRDQLYTTMCEAFADYQVDMSALTEPRLFLRCTKNAVDWPRSVGAFEDGRMVGFTLVGVDDWGGELTAFDVITGIIPSHRGQGLAKRMFDHVVPLLAATGVRRFVLEVLQPNEAAIRAYSKTGFEITRELDCLELKLESLPAPSERFELREVARSTVQGFEAHLDWLPSFENRLSALPLISEDVLTLGAFDAMDSFNKDRCLGVLAYYPTLNWLLTLIVPSQHRRRGVGTALLLQLALMLQDRTPSIRVINVDHSDQGMLRFVEHLGGEAMVSQYEMEYRFA